MYLGTHAIWAMYSKSRKPKILGPGFAGEVTYVGVFQRDLIPHIYVSFVENYGLHQTTRSTSTTRDSKQHLPSTSFKNRTSQPLAGPLIKEKVTKKNSLKLCFVENSYILEKVKQSTNDYVKKKKKIHVKLLAS